MIKLLGFILLTSMLGFSQVESHSQKAIGTVDNTTGTTVKPFKQGLSAAIPATCAVGEAYFKTDATAGQNFFACTAVNTWTLQSGSGATTTAALTDLLATRTSATLMTITAPAAGTVFRCGSKATRISTNVTITLAASSAAASSQFFPYFDCASAAMKVDTSTQVTQGNVTLVGATFGSAAATAFPASAVPVAIFTAGNNTVNQWDTSAITDWRAAYSNLSVTGTSPVTVTPQVDGSVVVAYDSTVAAPAQWYPHGFFYDVANNFISGGANTMYCAENLNPLNTSFTVNFARFYIATLEAGKTAGWNIYSTAANPARLGPATSTGVTTASTGVVGTTTGAIALPPGPYMSCFGVDGVVAAFLSVGASMSYFQGGTTARIFSCANAISVAGGVITWPATCGARSAMAGGSVFPIVNFLNAL